MSQTTAHTNSHSVPANRPTRILPGLLVLCGLLAACFLVVRPEVGANAVARLMELSESTWGAKSRGSQVRDVETGDPRVAAREKGNRDSFSDKPPARGKGGQEPELDGDALPPGEPMHPFGLAVKGGEREFQGSETLQASENDWLKGGRLDEARVQRVHETLEDAQRLLESILRKEGAAS